MSIKLLRLSPRKYLDRIEEFLYSEALPIHNGCFSIGILCWSSVQGNKRRLLLGVESISLQIVERQKAAFVQAFKGQHVPLFEDFWSEKISGKAFDYSSSIQFIKDRT